jgi:hypothetical protein
MKTEQLIGALVADLDTPVSDVKSRLRRLLPWSALIVAVSFLSVFGLRGDVATTGLVPVLGKVTLGLVVATLGLVAAVHLSRPDRPAAAARRVLFLVPMMAAMVVAADFLLSGSPQWSMRLFGKSFIACLTIIPLLAALPLCVVLWSLRDGATPAPATAGALAGFASAGIAIVVYGLYCIEDALPFVATWYVLASCLVAAAGAVGGRLLLRW